jgi:hypothetical protein
MITGRGREQFLSNGRLKPALGSIDQHADGAWADARLDRYIDNRAQSAPVDRTAPTAVGLSRHRKQGLATSGIEQQEICRCLAYL